MCHIDPRAPQWYKKIVTRKFSIVPWYIIYLWGPRGSPWGPKNNPFILHSNADRWQLSDSNLLLSFLTGVVFLLLVVAPVLVLFFLETEILLCSAAEVFLWGIFFGSLLVEITGCCSKKSKFLYFNGETIWLWRNASTMKRMIGS